MFEKPFKLKLKRNLISAIGFYTIHLFILIIFSILGFLIIKNAFSLDQFVIGIEVGKISAIFYSVSLSILILYKKKLFKNPVLVIIGVSPFLLAYYGGGILGLLPASFLSTK